MRKIITFGVFDYFHLGHLRLFEQCKKYGDYLIVAVQEEAYITKTKPWAKKMYSTEQRVELIQALKIVDCVVKYTDVDTSIQDIEFDVLALGEDQQHDGFIRAAQWCENNNKKVVRLKRTAGISSSDIKKELK